MEQLIIQLVSGAVGGNAAGMASKNFSLGTLGNTLIGILGGAGGGQLLAMLGGGGAAVADAAAGGGGDLMSVITQVAGGAGGGGVLVAVVGMIKNMMSKGE